MHIIRNGGSTPPEVLKSVVIRRRPQATLGILGAEAAKCSAEHYYLYPGMINAFNKATSHLGKEEANP
jgi:hypothetical protein